MLKILTACTRPVFSCKAIHRTHTLGPHLLSTSTRSMAPTTQPPANPRPIVISGPSGTGKSTLLKRLFAAHPDVFGFSISHTTRSPRAGEAHGREYHFVTRAEFEKLVEQRAFVEHATFGGNMYGTSVQAVKDVRDRGRVCVLDIDMEGAKQVTRTDLNARFVFLAPPSLDILEQRLRGRGTETEESTQARLDAARREMAWAYETEPRPHERIVVNDELDTAYRELEEFILDGGKFGGS